MLENPMVILITIFIDYAGESPVVITGDAMVIMIDN